ncbi:hypothetical protein ACFWWM_34305 [Streptomyces sp. NPDC058682]|uniref:hypothetical protein n=1 Tax=Streptomyces sp. NPDC058682 TaxID=3346596 RepID=UPI00365A39BC
MADPGGQVGAHGGGEHVCGGLLGQQPQPDAELGALAGDGQQRPSREIVISALDLNSIYDVWENPRIRVAFIRDGDSLGEIASFLSGYFLALQIHGIDEDFALGQVGDFSNWLSRTYGTSPTGGWISAVEQLAKEGESSVEVFLRLLKSFREV